MPGMKYKGEMSRLDGGGDTHDKLPTGNGHKGAVCHHSSTCSKTEEGGPDKEKEVGNEV